MLEAGNFKKTHKSIAGMDVLPLKTKKVLPEKAQIKLVKNGLSQ